MKKTVLFSALALSLLTGCQHIHPSVILDTGHYHGKSMPPAHAPAHGRRAHHHQYHYYPSAEFYFDMERNLYFYMNRGVWTYSVSLPLRLQSFLHTAYVQIDMDNERPYIHHKEHKNKYKAKHKKRENKRAKREYKEAKREYKKAKKEYKKQKNRDRDYHEEKGRGRGNSKGWEHD